MTAARAFDWGVGDVRMDEGGRPIESESPEAERIAFVLSTQLGECG